MAVLPPCGPHRLPVSFSCRYSIFQERADAWTPEALAVWLARFLEGSPAGVQQQEELPPELDAEMTWPALAHLVPQAMQLWR